MSTASDEEAASSISQLEESGEPISGDVDATGSISGDIQHDNRHDQVHYSSHSGYDEIDEDDRENRWQGSESTWRYYTRDERSLVASLDQQQADDLSIHLYNVHALKARLYDPKICTSSDDQPRVTPWSSKQQWILRSNEDEVPWYPTKEWASWPLRPDEVPRSNEAFGRDGKILKLQQESLKNVESWYPSQHLEEELLAVMMRKAKEQFLRRRWEVLPSEALRRARSQRGSDGNPVSRASSVLSSISGVSEAETNVHHGSHRKHDQEDAEIDEQQEAYSVPNFITDDDMASEMLRRPIRHIISKLDDLLLGLHKSRLGQVSAKRSRSQSRSHSLNDPSRRTAKSSGGVKPGAATHQSSSSSESEAPPSPRKRQRVHSSERSQTLGVRDWSEILGIASISGWDQNIVRRTAKRCAMLFGENIAFQILPETASHHLKLRSIEYISSQLPEIPPLTGFIDADEDESSDNIDFTRKQKTLLYCPSPTCPRHASNSFTKAFRFREHLKRVHKYTPRMIAELESEIDTGLSSRPTSGTSTPGEQSWTPPSPLICPIGGCKKMEKVYPQPRRLVEHLRRVHGWDPRVDGEMPSIKRATEDVGEKLNVASEQGVEDDVFGAVHNDGYLQPIDVKIPNRNRRAAQVYKAKIEVVQREDEVRDKRQRVVSSREDSEYEYTASDSD